MTTIDNRHPYRDSFIPAMQGEASPLRHCVRFLLCAMMFISFAACSDQNGKDDPDDPGFEEGIPTEVRITLSARSANAQTRADEKVPDGEPKDPTSSIELIHNWWIVFIDSSKKVVKIIKDTDTEPVVYDKTPSTSVNLTGGGYEAETFRTVIPSGTYRIYAFANIPFDEEVYAEIFEDPKKFKDGKLTNVHIKDFVPTAFSGNDNSKNNDMQWRDTENIPMTQILKDLVIKNTVEEAFNIEVVRTVAKVQFSFSNPSADTITIKELRFSPISKGDKISIVPNNDSVGFAPNTKLITDKVETGNLTFDLGSKILATKQDHSFSFYCNESLPHDAGKYINNPDPYDKSKIFTDLYTQHFTIDLKIDRNGKEEEKSLYTSKITYINRNDWIYIPISFAKWEIKWRMHYYPPIGGYPPLFEQSNDGEKVEILATTAGEFEIFPDMYENGTEYALIPTEWENVKIDPTKIKETDLDGNALPAGESLFVVLPTKQTAKGMVANKDRYYIAGEFSNVEGKATIEVEFKLSAGPFVNQLKTCTFTITRKNGYITPQNH